MPRYIASYDLNNHNSPHFTFIGAAEKHGWSTWVLSNNSKWFKLPNTTLVGDFTDYDTAVAAFEAIKSTAEIDLGLPITIEKWIVAEYSQSTFVSDETSP